MKFHRFGAAALVFAIATGAQVLRAQACDERIAGSCKPAPITNPSTLVNAGGAEPVSAASSARRHYKKRSHRYRYRRHHYRARYRHAVKPRSRPAEIMASDSEDSRRVNEARTRSIAGAFRNSRAAADTVGLQASVPQETWANVPTPAAPAAPPQPLTRGIRAGAFDASLLAAPATAVQTAFVASRVDQGENTAEARPHTLPIMAATPTGPESNFTIMRALFLALAGMLAIGTAVRLAI